MGEWQANGQRVGTALIGKWDLTTTSDMGTRTSRLVIEPDLTGTYESFGGEIPIKDLKLNGNQVAFSVEFGGFGGNTFQQTFKGTLDGKTLKGQLESDRGTSDVTGKMAETKPAM